MNKIFFITSYGTLVSAENIATAAMITDEIIINPLNHEEVRAYAARCKGIKEELKNPSIEDLVRYGNLVAAIEMLRSENPGMSYTSCAKIINDKVKDLTNSEENKED